jgi:hypothetical protein
MMRKRARFAVAAEEWLKRHAPNEVISTRQFWERLSRDYPDLTTASEHRKTPKATCMRDIRKDGTFNIADGKISLKR